MQNILDILSRETKKAFEEAGYESDRVTVTLSNRPDLCDYQCNGAMPLAKTAHKAPIMIAQEVAEKMAGCEFLESAEAVNPGFLNLVISKSFLADYINQMEEDDNLGFEKVENPKTIIIDYGGPNVAKPLHVGHLRSAIIGESIKRIGRYVGNKVIGDVHLGDWGQESRNWYTLMKTMKENILQRRRLPYPSLKKSTRRHRAGLRKMKTIRMKHSKLRLSCRRGEEGIRRCLNTFLRFPLPI